MPRQAPPRSASAVTPDSGRPGETFEHQRRWSPNPTCRPDAAARRGPHRDIEAHDCRARERGRARRSAADASALQCARSDGRWREAVLRLRASLDRDEDTEPPFSQPDPTANCARYRLPELGCRAAGDAEGDGKQPSRRAAPRLGGQRVRSSPRHRAGAPHSPAAPSRRAASGLSVGQRSVMRVCTGGVTPSPLTMASGASPSKAPAAKGTLMRMGPATADRNRPATCGDG